MNHTTDTSDAIREIGEILADGYLRLLKRRSDKPANHKQVMQPVRAQIHDEGPCYRGATEQ